MPSAPVERILARLENVRPSGEGWSARCPAHDDRMNSLSIGQGEDGRALVHCFAGCETNHVVGAIGLKMSHLFPDPGRGGRERKGGRSYLF